MIVVLGRPGIRRDAASGQIALDGLAATIAVEVARRGSAVELVGSVGDDPDGDRAIVELGRGGVGHAAVLRDPAGVTPGASASGASPRLDAGDVELGLRYLPECRVVIVAEPLPDAALGAAAEGASYHGAALIVLVEPGVSLPKAIASDATVLELPAVEEPAADSAVEGGSADGPGEAFGSLVAAYAVGLDRGDPADAAFDAATSDTRWDRAGSE
jgi:hypothetical protein